MRETLEGVYKQCFHRTRNLFHLGPRLFSDGIKPSNGSTSRGVLEIVAGPGRVFFPASSWSKARFHGHYLYDQSHRSLSLRARRYAAVVTTLRRPRKHRSSKRRDSFLTFVAANSGSDCAIDCAKQPLRSSTILFLTRRHRCNRGIEKRKYQSDSVNAFETMESIDF